MTNEELFNWCCKQNCNRFFNCDLCMYEKGRADVIARDYNTILIYEDTIRSMLLNTSQENNLIDWVDLNGKLNAITHIKHLIYELKEQKNDD